MPYVWDGHDNATRVQETGHGFKMPRYDWTDARSRGEARCLHQRSGNEGEARRYERPHAGPQRARRRRLASSTHCSRRAATMPETKPQSAPRLHERRRAPISSTGASSRTRSTAPRIRAGGSCTRAEQPAGMRASGSCTPGRWRLSIPRDELCHFVAGRATYRTDDGETIEVEAGTSRHVSRPAGPANAPSTRPCATSTCSPDRRAKKNKKDITQ